MGMMIDPHTADGVHVATDLLDEVEGKIVSLETALPVKFLDTILEATGEFPEVPERFEGIEDGPRIVLDLPNDVDRLKQVIEAKS